MNTLELVRINLHGVHDQFTKTVADVTQEMADWVPPGVAHPIGERYAHAVAAEDWLVNSLSKASAPWFATTWAGKTGYGNLTLAGVTVEEARAFRVDVNTLHDYARAVFASSEEFLNTADLAEMERVYDMSAVGFGMLPAPIWWSAFIIDHLHDVMGEISILKGCLGYTGYPF